MRLVIISIMLLQGECREEGGGGVYRLIPGYHVNLAFLELFTVLILVMVPEPEGAAVLFTITIGLILFCSDSRRSDVAVLCQWNFNDFLVS